MQMSKWSQKKIKLGIKKVTARSRKFPNDPDVLFIFSIPIPLWIIKRYFYIEEGADSPEELQRKINGIWRRKVSEDRLLYLHVLKQKKDDRIFHDHIKAHFEKDNPDWKVCCKICGKTYEEIINEEKNKIR